jgi:exopolyphosphatase/guanosine-5'-triphosphate,3'-diphosphate pyrophosphatase
MNLDPAINRTETNETPQVVAVIDIGASSIRMQIAELSWDRTVRKLESLSQAVSIGRDSFTRGVISKESIEDCVRVLKIYRQRLVEYGINSPKSIRVVGTSGVREASNRLAFQDRIYIATGFELEPFDEAELHRVTYLGIQPFLKAHAEYFSGDTVVSEVGGGTTEFLFLNREDVAFARTFRLGALRLRRVLDSYDAPQAKTRRILESQISQAIQQIQHLVHDETAAYVAMGGDIRFAVSQLLGGFQSSNIARLSVKQLQEFTEEILESTPDSLASQFHLSLPDANSLGPALLTHAMLAKHFHSEELLVVNVNLRDGLLMEMASHGRWSESIQSQIVRSATLLGKKYDFDLNHANHTAYLACQLFDQWRPLHGMDNRFQMILHLAALLHEIGVYVNLRSYHKHSMYLIQNSELFGIGERDLLLIGLVARYHRRATPQPSHEGYSLLDRESRVAVAKLASILRIASALDVTRSQRIAHLQTRIVGDEVQLIAAGVSDLAVEHLELRDAGAMFEDLFGCRLILGSEETLGKDES